MDDICDLEDVDCEEEEEVEINDVIESYLLYDDDEFEPSDLPTIDCKDDDASDAYSLDALISKKQNLLIQSRLSGSNANNEYLSNCSQLSVNSDSDANTNSNLDFDNCVTSTPRLKTPAVKILDKWKPSSFSLDSNATRRRDESVAEDQDLSHINKKIRNSDDDDEFFTTLDNYSNKLASYTQKDDKTIDDIMNELTACLQEADRTIEEYGSINDKLTGLDDLLDDEDKTLLPDMKSFVEASVKLEQAAKRSSSVVDDGKTSTVSTNAEIVLAARQNNSEVPEDEVDARKSATDDVSELQMKKSAADKEIDSLGVLSSDDEEIGETATMSNIDEDTLLASDDECKPPCKVKSTIKTDENEKSDEVLPPAKVNKEITVLTIQTQHHDALNNKSSETLVPPKSSTSTVKQHQQQQRDDKHDTSKKKDNVAQLKEFISDDPDENRDNNDPMWNLMRNLGSDYERYAVVQKRWKNLGIPNPKKNLTCRHRGRKDTVNNDDVTKTSKNVVKENNRRSGSSAAASSSHSKLTYQLCTVLFDRRIKQFNDQVERRLNSLHNNCRVRLQHLADCQQIEKQMLMLSRENSIMAINLLDIRHTREAEEIMRTYVRQREDVVSAANSQLDALKSASEEMKQMHEFYPSGDADGNSLVYLNEEEIEEIREIDDMISTQYEQIYKKQ